MLWTFSCQSCSLGNLLRDSASRAGGGLRGLQTDDMVLEHGYDVYHSSHLLLGNNVIVNQCTIHLRRAKPTTCNCCCFSYGYGNIYCVAIPISLIENKKSTVEETVLLHLRSKAAWFINSIWTKGRNIPRAGGRQIQSK